MNLEKKENFTDIQKRYIKGRILGYPKENAMIVVQGLLIIGVLSAKENGAKSMGFLPLPELNLLKIKNPNRIIQRAVKPRPSGRGYKAHFFS